MAAIRRARQHSDVLQFTGARAFIDAMIGRALDLGIDPAATAANTPRNPQFGREGKAWLHGKVCMVCGGRRLLRCHHKFPFHLYPSLEMVREHWRPLCQGDRRLNCHLLVGHLGNYESFNPLVDELAGLLRASMRISSELLRAIKLEIRERAAKEGIAA